MSIVKVDGHSCSECGTERGQKYVQKCDSCGLQESLLPVRVALQSHDGNYYSEAHICGIGCLKKFMSEFNWLGGHEISVDFRSTELSRAVANEVLGVPIVEVP